ncbi:MAG: peptidase M20 [Chloroflexi bacterium]|nr:MAG: peptidase M20 [Chloroflexota bacterium]
MTDRLVTHLETRLEAYLADLASLASIDSGSYDKPGVDAVQTWLGQRLAALGCTIQRLPHDRFGDTLIARIAGSGSGRVLLLGHADTVYPPGTGAARPLRQEGDRLLGPGTCDMKAGLLSGIYALEALLATGSTGFGHLTMLVVPDEEIGERHTIDLLRSEGAAHDIVLTLEAARENGDIVTARKAVAWYCISATGKAAHAGVEPEKGASATVALAHVIVGAAALNGVRPGVTLNIAPIEGGRAPNIVADSAQARVDLRAWTNADLQAAAAALRALLATSPVAGVTISMTLEPGSDCPAMERTAGVARLEHLAGVLAHELGFEVHGAATGGASDISFACQGGTPGLDGLGPVGGLDHSPDEYILRSSIVPRAALLARLIERGASA